MKEKEKKKKTKYGKRGQGRRRKREIPKTYSKGRQTKQKKDRENAKTGEDEEGRDE